MTEITYEQRYCLFFDVLGFKNKVRIHDPKGIHDVLQEIRTSHNYRETYGENLFSSRKVTQFSDNLVVSYLKGDFVGWMSIISDVFYLQLSLIKHGFLIRGSVTVGELFHNDQFCFGPALIEAAELEKSALYPRVILTDEFAPLHLVHNSTAKFDLTDGRNINNMVTMDLDGMLYIDYFNVIAEDFDTGLDGLFQYLSNLKSSIVELGVAAKNNTDLKLKYAWMRRKYGDMMTSIWSGGEPSIYGQSVTEVYKNICSELRFSE
jgi:hypothetical protein